jgi:hypothetical protein
MKPQSSSAVGGAAVFGERSKELLETLATMKPKDDLGHEESGGFSGLDVVDVTPGARRLHQFQD